MGEALDELEKVFVRGTRVRAAKTGSEAPGHWQAHRPSARHDEGLTMAAVSRAEAAALPRRVEVANRRGGLRRALLAIKLLEEGIRDFVVLEKDSEVGGTWRDNQYPGAECDVQSHLYSYSFEGKADWSQRYAGWKEIQRYILDTTEKYKLRPYIRFGQQVDGARLRRGVGALDCAPSLRETLAARHFVMATGPLHVPQMPDIKASGASRARCSTRHAGNHAYDLAGSVSPRSAPAQRDPVLPGDRAKVQQLHVLPAHGGLGHPARHTHVTARAQATLCEVRWWRRLHRRSALLTNESRVWPIFHAGPVAAVRSFRAFHLRPPGEGPGARTAPHARLQIGCNACSFEYVVPDVQSSERGTRDGGIREVKERGIVTDDGVEREVDCIILGTGFVVDPRIYMRDFPIVASGPLAREDWRGGAEAYYGLSVAGLSQLTNWWGPNTALGHSSIIFMIEAQCTTCSSVCASSGPQRDYIGARRRRAKEVQRTACSRP